MSVAQNHNIAAKVSPQEAEKISASLHSAEWRHVLQTERS